MRHAALPDDMAQLFGVATLLLSFALLAQRRLPAAINIHALQSMVLAAAACWQGLVQSAAPLGLAGAIILAVEGIAIPFALHRIARRLDSHRTVETAPGIFPAMGLGVGLVALAILVVAPTAPPAQVLTREDLATSLSVVLLGMLIVITRRSAVAQVVGLMSLGNGLILAAVGVAGTPLAVASAVVALVLVAGAVFAIFVLRLRERIDHPDPMARIPR